MKRTISLILCFSMFSGVCFAETVYLKDGTSTNGEIAETSKDSITVKTKFGNMAIPKSSIEKIEYNKRETQEESKAGQVNNGNTGNYEKEKLGIRTIDVYHSYSSVFEPVPHSRFFHRGRIYSATSVFPEQEWIITKGQFAITDLQFLSIIDPEAAVTAQKEIDDLIKSKEKAYTACWVTAIIGVAVLCISFVPLENVTLNGQTYQAYGALNSGLLFGGCMLTGIGGGIGISLENEISFLRQMPGDPTVHLNSLEYTQEKIDKYNKDLKIKFGISF